VDGLIVYKHKQERKGAMKIQPITFSAFYRCMVVAMAGLLLVPHAARAANYTWQCTQEFANQLSGYEGIDLE